MYPYKILNWFMGIALFCVIILSLALGIKSVMCQLIIGKNYDNCKAIYKHNVTNVLVSTHYIVTSAVSLVTFISIKGWHSCRNVRAPIPGYKRINKHAYFYNSLDAWMLCISVCFMQIYVFYAFNSTWQQWSFFIIELIHLILNTLFVTMINNLDLSNMDRDIYNNTSYLIYNRCTCLRCCCCCKKRRTYNLTITRQRAKIISKVLSGIDNELDIIAGDGASNKYNRGCCPLAGSRYGYRWFMLALVSCAITNGFYMTYDFINFTINLYNKSLVPVDNYHIVLLSLGVAVYYRNKHWADCYAEIKDPYRNKQ